MAKVDLDNIDSLRDLKAAFIRFKSIEQAGIGSADAAVRQNQEWLSERTAHWQNQANIARRKVDQARSALSGCRAQQDNKSRGCGREEDVLRSAEALLADCQRQVELCKQWQSRLERLIDDYTGKKKRLKTLASSTTEGAVRVLFGYIAAYEAAQTAEGKVITGGIGNNDSLGDVSNIEINSDLIIKQISEEEVEKELGRRSLWRDNDGNIVKPLGRDGRGSDFEKLYSANMGGNVPVIDDYDEMFQSFTSYKSIDLNGETYLGHTPQSERIIKEYITEASNVEGYRREKDIDGLYEGNVNHVLMYLAVPAGSLNAENRSMLERCANYARHPDLSINAPRNHPVHLVIFEVA